ncbi:MAG: M23 family metallopeptidase [Clostridiales bacterium]
MKKIISDIKKANKKNKDNPDNNKSLRIIIAIIGIPNLILILLVAFMVIYLASYMADSPFESSEKGTFVEALSDSIEMYGLDFTKALAAYLYEHKSFNNYDRINMWDYQDKEKLEDLMDNKTVNEFYEDFEKLYGGIVKKDDTGKIYHNWYFPIADETEVTYTNDYLEPRSFGGNREHYGNDLMCKEGIPIIAAESGTIESIGWQNLGGWRIGIRSEDGTRYWYYAHMRKVHPYVKNLKKGSYVNGGDVIGYVGSTGYSDILANNVMPENEKAVDGKFVTHLHFSVMKKSSIGDLWYNPYPFLEFIKRNKMSVEKINGESIALGKSIDQRYVYINSVFASGKIGQLSEKYESNGNPGIIANNRGDFGGKSYGAFQFSLNMGSLNSFLMWLKGADEDIYNRLIAAKGADGGSYSTNFDNEWKTVANEDSGHFYNLQYSYVKITFYDPVVLHFKNTGQIDFTKHSNALQNVVWSTSVQHGTMGATGIILKQNLNGSDEEIIIGIYNERQKVNIYFSSSSYAIRNSVYNRFEREKQDALNMLRNEN